MKPYVVVTWRDTSTTNGYYTHADVVREYTSRAAAERFAAAHPENGYVVRSSHFVADNRED